MSLKLATSALLNTSKIYRKVMMVPPTHYDVIHQNLNAYMDCSRPVDKTKAMQQWEGLRDTLNAHGLETEICQPEPGLVDMVFSANAAVVLNNKALISKMAAGPRRHESNHFAEWFRKAGFEVEELEKTGKEYMFCEGNAEFVPNHDLSQYFLGWGQRTAESALEPVRDYFSLDKNSVFKLRLIDERFYHLDVAMAPLCLGHIMFYPGAFDAESLKTLYNAVGSEEKLVAITEDEALQFSCNSISFSNGDEAVIVAPAFSPRLRGVLEEQGYKCVEVPYDQFLLSGGAVRCSVLDIAQTR